MLCYIRKNIVLKVHKFLDHLGKKRTQSVKETVKVCFFKCVSKCTFTYLSPLNRKIMFDENKSSSFTLLANINTVYIFQGFYFYI